MSAHALQRIMGNQAVLRLMALGHVTTGEALLKPGRELLNFQSAGGVQVQRDEIEMESYRFPCQRLVRSKACQGCDSALGGPLAVEEGLDHSNTAR